MTISVQYLLYRHGEPTDKGLIPRIMGIVCIHIYMVLGNKTPVTTNMVLYNDTNQYGSIRV